MMSGAGLKAVRLSSLRFGPALQTSPSEAAALRSQTHLLWTRIHKTKITNLR